MRPIPWRWVCRMALAVVVVVAVRGGLDMSWWAEDLIAVASVVVSGVLLELTILSYKAAQRQERRDRQ